MRLIHLLRVFLAGLLLTGMVYAQGIGASGDIRGTVTDPSGAVVTNATVTATDVARGIKHTVSTDNNGQYRLTGLQPAAYSVSVSKSGFQTELAKNVVVNIGQTSTPTASRSPPTFPGRFTLRPRLSWPGRGSSSRNCSWNCWSVG